MPDEKLSQLPAASVVNDADLLYLVQGGASLQAAASLIVHSFNSRTGAITLTTGDVTGVLGGGLPVVNGGTGDTSLGAYGVLCGGTTSTSPVQTVSALGTSGQVLTSNGAGALPSWQNASGGVSSFNSRTGAVTLTTADVNNVLASGLGVAQGGTGDTSLTAYSVLCGGTTTSGPVQSVSGLGSSGQVLTSNGASALPTWQPASAGSGTVTTFSAGNLSPLFTTSVATATTTPALTFTISNANANTVFAGPASGSAAAPTFRALGPVDAVFGVTADSDGATVTLDWSASKVHEVTLTASRTIAFSNDSNGASIQIIFKSGGTGVWTPSWPATVKWQGGSPPVLTNLAGHWDLISILREGSGSYMGAAALNFS